MAALLLLASPIACQRAEQGDGVRAQALLAEFSAAKPYVNESGAGRNRVEVGRDMMKLDRSAVLLFIKALDDPDPQVSAVAALALGRIGDSRAVEPMLKVLQSFIPVHESDSGTDSPGHLRAAACVCALGRLREPRAVGPIVALTRLRVPYSDLVRELGFQENRNAYMCGIMPILCRDAIHKIGLAAAPELIRLLSDADGEIRGTATEYLGRFGVEDRHSRLKRLAAAASRPDESAQLSNEREALKHEGKLSDRVAALAGGKLIELLHDKVLDVRREAASALGNLRVASAVGPLIERLRDEHPWVRLDAIHSLGQIGDPAALEALAPLLKNPGPDQSDCAECAVGMIGGPKALALLKSGLENTDPRRREAAIAGLSALGTPEAVDLQITALRDKDLCFWAARALGELKGPDAARAVEPLIAAARDEVGARRAALEALGKIADPRGVDVAIAALKDPDHWVRAAAVMTLGFLKDPKSVEPVKAMLKDPEWLVRNWAVGALAELNPPGLSECLKPLLEDENISVRVAAKSALEHAAKSAEDRTKNR